MKIFGERGPLEQIFSCKDVCFPLSVSFHLSSILIHSSVTSVARADLCKLREQLNNTHNRIVVAIHLQWRSEVSCSVAIRLRGGGASCVGRSHECSTPEEMKLKKTHWVNYYSYLSSSDRGPMNAFSFPPRLILFLRSKIMKVKKIALITDMLPCVSK